MFIKLSFSVARVIDLGVMTPCEKILQTAIDEKAGEILFYLVEFTLTLTHD